MTKTGMKRRPARCVAISTRMLSKVLCCALAGIAVSGCAATNVLLNAPIQRVHSQTAPKCEDGTQVDYTAAAVRVYFDRDGDLYPFPAVPVLLRDTLFRKPWIPLRAAFDSSKHWAPEWHALADSLRIHIRSPLAWRHIQDSLRARTAKRIHAATLGSADRRPLIVLVHGFNVADAECTYQAVRARIDSLGYRGSVLQMNWDGLSASGPPVIWSEAQFNFPLVGMGLRLLLNELAAIDSTIPLRFLTHSSGGPVVAHALWDASAAEGRTRHGNVWPAYVHLQRMRRDGTLPPPPGFSDVRVGMIVPAMPASIFDNYALGQKGPERILIGFNPNDFAVGKTVLVPCSWYGNTCLPVRASYACSVVARFANDGAPEVLVFDFSGSKVNASEAVFHDKHDWALYMRRDRAKSFVDALLGDTPPADDRQRLCPRLRSAQTPPGPG